MSNTEHVVSFYEAATPEEIEADYRLLRDKLLGGEFGSQCKRSFVIRRLTKRSFPLSGEEVSRLWELLTYVPAQREEEERLLSLAGKIEAEVLERERVETQTVEESEEFLASLSAEQLRELIYPPQPPVEVEPECEHYLALKAAFPEASEPLLRARAKEVRELLETAEPEAEEEVPSV